VNRPRPRTIVSATFAITVLLIVLAAPLSALAQETCPNEALRAEQGSTLLPDCRAYELVSPPDKNGADVAPDSQRTRAAADGSALSFVSLGGFADVRGTGQATEYIAERSAAPGTTGWGTHAITPKQDPLSFFAAFQQALEPAWQHEFSPDLSKGIFRAWSPVTDQDPNVVNVENLYRRTDLRSAGAGSYQLLTPCLACATPISPFSILLLPHLALPELAGASADFSHVAFESPLPLTADAGPGMHLYEWADGTLRLADILPDGACGSPPCHATRSAAGPGAGSGPPHIVSADGSRIVFTDTSTGKLYERIGGSQTVQINASERTTPEVPQAAIYQTASVDDKRVFFTTAEQLTNADTNGVIDLYMWDATASAGHHLTLLSVDSTPGHDALDVDGVIGASDDGRYVYFVDRGQLVAGKPFTGNPGFFLWHEGAAPAVTYIGEMANPVDTGTDLLNHASLSGGTRGRVTPDGRHMAFISHSGVGLLSEHGGADYNQQACGTGCGEFYLYSADTGGLGCTSCNPSGAPATTNADTWVRGGTLVSTPHVTHSLSEDGQRFFFHTTEALVPQDTNGRSDLYEYDAQTGKVHLISSGHDPSESFFMDASADGSNVFFLTRQRLTGWDTDQSLDLYDARIGGGFPAPPASAPQCEGEACHGSAPESPGSATYGTGFVSGAGNLPPPPAVGPPAVTPSVRPLTNAQRLSKALAACRKVRKKSQRKKCESQAHKRWAAHRAARSGSSK
jgi:Tol biopolymer transport system component